MLKHRKAPEDKNGIPLSIIPSEEMTTLPLNSDLLTRHHQRFLPGRQRYTTAGGFAIRAGRILRVERRVHNTAIGSEGQLDYHCAYDISAGPADDQGRYEELAWDLAGYQPEEGVDLWGSEAEIRPMTTEERAILTTPHPVNPRRFLHFNWDSEHIRPFMWRHIFSQPLEAFSNETIQLFASAESREEVRQVTPIALSELVTANTMRIRPAYDEAYAEGLLHPYADSDLAVTILDGMGYQYESYRANMLRSTEERLRLAQAAGYSALQGRQEEVELAA